jgi:dihydropteroate synthase
MQKSVRIGSRNLSIGERTYIMGILNVTPDSFSDGGSHNRLEDAKAFARQMMQEGADIIDVGGESTRPGYIKISDEEEIQRIVPVIEAIRQESDIPISIDTYKSKVARAACLIGADMINDIWGLKYDPDMAGVAYETGAAVCLMHNRKEPDYRNFLNDVLSDLQESIRIAKQAGIPMDKMIVDPGIGFAKTYEMNLRLLKHLEILKELGLPILLGASRKSVIGLTLKEPADQRLEGTIATSVIAVMKGCDFVRVHDVKQNLRAVRMAQAIQKCE